VGKPHTLAIWDRNAEEEQVIHYRIYLCDYVGCELRQIPGMNVDNVPQPMLGEQPQWVLPKGIQGVLAVSAVNEWGESELSQSVAFAS
jgi:hypothetical protein